VEVTVIPTKGYLQLESDGSFTYTPETNDPQNDTFTYSISSDAGTSNAVVTLNIMPVNITTGTVLTYKSSDIPALKGKDFAKAPKLYGLFPNNKKGNCKKIKNSTGTVFSGAWSKKYSLYDKKLIKNGYNKYFESGPSAPVPVKLKVKGKTAQKEKIDAEIQTVYLVPPVITEILDSKGHIITTENPATPGATITVKGKYFGMKAPKTSLETEPGKLLKCKVLKPYKYTDYKGKASASCMDPYSNTGESEIKITLPVKNITSGKAYPFILNNKTGIATDNVTHQLPAIYIK
jgi:hypothetical protein